MKSCSFAVILSSTILLASAAGQARGQAPSKCTSGSAFGQSACLESQLNKELTREKDLIENVKKRRSDVAEDLDKIVLMEKAYREEYCQLVGALENGEPRWRSVWTAHCSLHELHRFNNFLINYSK